MSKIGFTITKDLIDNGLMVGKVYGDYTIEELKENGIEFKLFDDDGECYFKGLSLATEDLFNGEEHLFAPLDQFGASYGCVDIHYKNREGRFESI